MKQYLKYTMAVLVFAFCSFGLSTSLDAQSNPNWQEKAESNTTIVSVANEDCSGYNVFLYKVDNKTNQAITVSYNISYDHDGVVINETKSIAVPPSSANTPDCERASMGMTDAFNLLPDGHTADLSKMTISIL